MTTILDTLGDALTDCGLLTRPTPTRTAKPLSRSQLAMLLVNPYYIGIVRYAGVEYAGNHEPLIDRATFQRACSVTKVQSPSISCTKSRTASPDRSPAPKRFK